jgi:hypothetical protein
MADATNTPMQQPQQQQQQPQQQQQQLLDPEAVFNDTVKGRFPLSSSISAARFWAAETITKKDAGQSCKEVPLNNIPNIPRPNVDLNWLSWISLFGGPLGLDHFYANSPATGIAKLLTVGGGGLWWLWDVLQLWLEPKRVLSYGMMPLFDVRFHEPVAQGMITDKPHPYRPTGFSLWAILEIVFGFFGLSQLFYKKVELTVVYLLFVAGLIIYYQYSSEMSTFSLAGKVSYILLGVVLSVAGIAHGIRWITNASRILLDPEKLFKNGAGHGLPIDPQVDVLVNPYNKELRKELEVSTPSALFESYTAEQLRRMFMIRTLDEFDDPDCVKSAGLFASVWAMISSFLFSPFVGIRDFFQSIFSAIKELFIKPTTETPMSGGGGGDPLSTESLVLGGTLIALVLGGLIKGSIDHFVPNS